MTEDLSKAGIVLRTLTIATGASVAALAFYRFITAEEFFNHFWLLLLSLTAAGLLFALTGFFTSRRLANLQLTVLSTLLALVCANSLALLYEMLTEPQSKYQVVMQLRTEDPSVVPALIPNLAFRETAFRQRFDDVGLRPVGGVAKVTTVLCREAGPMIVYRSDRYGFRNDDDAYDRQPIDVLLVGDSFAHGACVDGDTTTWLQAKGLNAVTIGMSGNGPLLELASLREYGPAIQPRHIVWMFYENDIGNLATEREDRILRRYVDEPEFSQNLIVMQDVIDAEWRSVIAHLEATTAPSDDRSLAYYLWMLRRAVTLGKIRELLQLTGYIEHDYEPPSRATLDEIRSVFAAAKATAARMGATLHVVFLPSVLDVANGHMNAAAEIKPLLDALDIPTIDFFEHMLADGNPISFFANGYHSGHYNEKGYSLLADRIADLQTQP